MIRHRPALFDGARAIIAEAEADAALQEASDRVREAEFQVERLRPAFAAAIAELERAKANAQRAKQALDDAFDADRKRV